MKGLQVTLVAKIVLTFLWSVPLLCCPAVAARRLRMPEPKPRVWVHLLGAAFAALNVGYGLALRRSLRGQEVTDTVWVGFVSNGLACTLLLMFRRDWRQWGGTAAQMCLWVSTGATFLITAGLLVFGLVPALVRHEPSACDRSHYRRVRS